MAAPNRFLVPWFKRQTSDPLSDRRAVSRDLTDPKRSQSRDHRLRGTLFSRRTNFQERGNSLQIAKAPVPEFSAARGVPAGSGRAPHNVPNITPPHFPTERAAERIAVLAELNREVNE